MAARIGGILANVSDLTGKIIRDAKYQVIALLVGSEVVDQIIHYSQTGQFEVDVVPEWWQGAISQVVGEAERIIGEPLFEFLIAAPSGARLSREGNAQEATAVAMVQRMIGFAVALPYATARIEAGLTALMGENAVKPFAEALRKIPEEIGISWALGNVMDRILEVAAAQPIEEAIAEQTRPQRMEWQQLRALARLHVISSDELAERLRKAGWRDSDIPQLQQLDRASLGVSELQQLYLYGLRDEGWIRAYLDRIGFEGDDAQAAIDLYLKRAETAGGDQLRAVAQRQFLASILTEQQYRAILQRVNVPPLSIDLEVEAARLVKSRGQRQLSIAEIKKLHADNVIDDAQAILRLIEEDYTDSDATALVDDWKVDKVVARTGIDENRVLSYYVSGALTSGETYDRLIRMRISPTDARFLVEHPEAARVVKSHGASESIIAAAFEDDILTYTEAVQKLVANGASEDAANLTMRVVAYRANRGKKPKQAHKSLSEAQIIDAFKLGLGTSAWATRELVTAGYTDADALTIIATEETKLTGTGTLPDGWQVLT